MGLFKEFEKTAQVYWLVNNSNNKTQVRDLVVDATLPMHIIRRHEVEREVMGDQIADYIAHPDGDVTETLKPNSKIVWDSKVFKIVGDPEYLPNVDQTLIRLKRNHKEENS